VYVLAVSETPHLFNAYRLPLPQRRQGRAAALSLAAHVTIAVLVLWRGAALLEGGGGGTGPRGGGGGGGRPVVTWFTLPVGAAPQALDVPAPPAVTVPTIAPPDPVKIDVPPLEAIVPPPPAMAPAGNGTGTTGGPGQGPGSGGGQGTGTGPGRGNDVGPGSGGEAGYIPADVRGLIVPPDCARGEYLVRFWVEADGRVSQVDVTPPPKDAGCRREMLAQMRAYKFRPATRDGERVASVFPIRLVH
jgi:hypothetical protein